MPSSDQPEDQSRSYVRAIADLHDEHSERLVRARRVRGARVAAADARAASRIAPLVARCGASIVPIFADPEIVVIADHGLFADRSPLGALNGEVVQESELTAMVEAFEHVYRSRALEDATRRAKTRIHLDGPAPKREHGPEGPGRGMRTRTTPRVAPSAITRDERELESAMRRKARREAA